MVQNTRKPIELVDNTPLISILEQLDEEVNVRETVRLKKKRFTNSTSLKLLRPLSNSHNSLSIKKKEAKSAERAALSSKSIFELTTDEKGVIHCSSDFSAATFANIFSSDLCMEMVGDKYVFMSGTIQDILHYCILHSGLEGFR